MARSHGKILVGIWIDPDFIDLDPIEQWAFQMLLSQPKLNLVGCIDYQPGRWAQLANGLTTEAVIDAMEGLEVAGFVCIDRDTDELLIRSMTKHDGLRSNNPKLMKGLWGQWTGIASRMLRGIAIDNMPASLFEGSEIPEAAVRMRRSPRMDCAIVDPIVRPIVDASERANEPPSAFHHPPSAVLHCPFPGAIGSETATSVVLAARAAAHITGFAEPNPAASGAPSDARLLAAHTNGANA